MRTELPKELPESLHHAVLVLDKATMAVFIERIDANTPDTAIGLHRLVNDFYFRRIRNLLGDII